MLLFIMWFFDIKLFSRNSYIMVSEQVVYFVVKYHALIKKPGLILKDFRFLFKR